MIAHLNQFRFVQIENCFPQKYILSYHEENGAKSLGPPVTLNNITYTYDCMQSFLLWEEEKKITDTLI